MKKLMKYYIIFHKCKTVEILLQSQWKKKSFFSLGAKRQYHFFFDFDKGKVIRPGLWELSWQGCCGRRSGWGKYLLIFEHASHGQSGNHLGWCCAYRRRGTHDMYSGCFHKQKQELHLNTMTGNILIHEASFKHRNSSRRFFL